jgi:plastocyanin
VANSDVIIRAVAGTEPSAMIGSQRLLPPWALALLVPSIAAVAVVVTLTTTSAGTTRTGSPSSPTAGDTITIRNFAYAPPTLHVAVGATITVRNVDSTTHTVTARAKSFDTGDLDAGATATITIDRPGTYRYYCDIHNYMTGTIDAR